MVLKKLVETGKRLSGVDNFIKWQRQEFDKLKILAGAQLLVTLKPQYPNFKNIQEAEFSVFSQWGDDGIVQYLIHQLNITNKTFIEFGVQNYLEANTRFLLINNNWKGLIIDGSEENMHYVREDEISHGYNITAVAKFLDKNNLNETIHNAGFTGEIGLLHIDVDGNDYWFWECLNVVNPQIVIMEYNSLFGSKHPISVPYKDDFYVTDAHFSNLYFGTSLAALNHLAEQKGYSLVGSNSHGNNAYFIRNDLMNGMKKLSVEDAYVKSRFRQNRNANGNLTLTDDHEAVKQCGHLPIVNVIANETKELKYYL